MKHYTLFEILPDDAQRKVFDTIADSPFEAFESMRQLSYGLQTIGAKTMVTSAENPILQITIGKKVVNYILVEQ